MIIKRKPYKTYTKEFKLEAVRLMEASEAPPIKRTGLLGEPQY